MPFEHCKVNEIGTSYEETSSSGRDDSHFVEIEHIENSLSIENLASYENSLDTLKEVTKYYLDGVGHPRLRKVLQDQILLSVVAITGAGLYGTASDDYAVSIDSELASRINYIVCTCITALVVLYNSTELFLVMRRTENIPVVLIPYLANPTTRIQKILEDIAIFTGAAISALPLAAVSFMYPIPGFSKTLLLLQGIVVLIDNTILHLFPFKLAFSEPLYRLPSLPFEWMIQHMMDCRLSVEEKEKRQLQAQINQYYNAITQRLTDHLDLAQKRLSIYSKKIKTDIRDIKESHHHSSTELLIALLTRLRELAHDRPYSAPPSRLRKFLRTMSYIPGAFWVISSCAGFLAAPYNEMTELTDSPLLGATLSAPPIYFLGVLLAFFGGNAMQNTFDYFTDWKDEAVKIPMSFKLYPKTATLLIILSFYLASFSYAAGAQLINDNFKGELEFLRPSLLALAETGLSFLSFTSMIDLFNNALIKFGQYGGNSNDNTMLIKLSEELKQIKNSIPRIKSTLLLESLALMDQEKLKMMLNIGDKADQEKFSNTLIQLAEKLKIKLLKESKLIDLKDDEVELLSQLKVDESHTVEKIETVLAYFCERPELPVLLKTVSEEYNAVCKLIKTLDSINLVSRLDILSYGSINNDNDLAGSSSETTPLLAGRARKKSLFFYNSRKSKHPCGLDDRSSGISSGFTVSSQMKI